MYQPRRVLIWRSAVAIAALILSACSSGPKVLSVEEHESVRHLYIMEMHSDAIAENTMGEDPVRRISVYTPPDYDESRRRYPVVYLLPTIIWTAESMMWSEAAEHYRLGGVGPDHSFIVVGVDGSHKFGGNVWTDSPVAGNWETFATEELPAAINKKFRTLSGPEHTGIAGLFTGAFAAMELGLKHPDVYGHVYAAVPPAIAADNGESIRSIHPALITPWILAYAPELVPPQPDRFWNAAQLANADGWPEFSEDLFRVIEERYGVPYWTRLTSDYQHQQVPQRFFVEHATKSPGATGDIERLYELMTANGIELEVLEIPGTFYEFRPFDRGIYRYFSRNLKQEDVD